jgi:hypothetical protein
MTLSWIIHIRVDPSLKDILDTLDSAKRPNGKGSPYLEMLRLRMLPL